MKEIWKTIEGYEGLYQASNLGRIKSFIRTKSYKILKSITRNDGYLMVFLLQKGFLVHRLILSTFVGNSDLECNHKNGIKSDNRLDNLEYCTRSENMLHAFAIGLKKAYPSCGEKNGMSKFKTEDIVFIRKSKNNIPRKFLADMFNTSEQYISSIWTNKKWKHLNQFGGMS